MLNRKKLKEPLIILVIALTVIFNLMYNGINEFSAGNEITTYNTKVEYSYSGNQFHTNIRFYDKNGNMQEIRDYTQIWTDDESFPEEGAIITIEERQGGFGYPVFKMTRVNVRIEKWLENESNSLATRRGVLLFTHTIIFTMIISLLFSSLQAC